MADRYKGPLGIPGGSFFTTLLTSEEIMARGRHIVRPARRQMVWIGSGFGVQMISLSNTLLASLNAAALVLRPFTVVRTHLVIKFRSDQQAASEVVQGVYTQQVVKETASAAGIGSLPGGIDESDVDFFVYQPVFSDFVLGTSVGLEQLMGPANYWSVDSKAMRKVGIDDDIVDVLDLRAVIGAIISVEGRQLIKLY